jgi:putative membrane protein
MKRLIRPFIAAAILPVAAWAQTATTTDDFVKKVALSDMLEIQSSQFALSRTPDADTKPFAGKMVKDHTQTSVELKGLIDSGKVKAELPSSMD